MPVLPNANLDGDVEFPPLHTPAPAELPNPSAFRVGQLATYLFNSYYTYRVAMFVAQQPGAAGLLPSVKSGNRVPLLSIPHKKPNRHEIHAAYFLGQLRDSPADEFERAYLSGALLRLGDALAAYGYFDRAPQLELVYHLRNGVAHGNRFNLTRGGVARLSSWPAHLQADFHDAPSFQIHPELDGQEVLWGFIERGDIVHLLMAMASHLNGLSQQI